MKVVGIVLIVFGMVGGIASYTSGNGEFNSIAPAVFFFCVGVAFIASSSKRKQKKSIQISQPISQYHQTKPIQTIYSAPKPPQIQTQAVNTQPRKKSFECNCDGCPKQGSCKYGRVVYDDFDHHKMSLWEKYLFLGVTDNTEKHLESNEFDNFNMQEFLKDSHISKTDKIEMLNRFREYQKNARINMEEYSKC